MWLESDGERSVPRKKPAAKPVNLKIRRTAPSARPRNPAKTTTTAMMRSTQLMAVRVGLRVATADRSCWHHRQPRSVASSSTMERNDPHSTPALGESDLTREARDFLFRLHANARVDAHRLRVHVAVRQKFDGERRELAGVAESLRKEHAGAQARLELVGSRARAVDRGIDKARQD